MKRLMTLAVAVFIAGIVAGTAGAQKQKDYPMVVMETSEGTIVIELYRDKAPITVDNFLWYVDHGFYDGLVFHRVIKGFMVQGGGFTADMVQKAGNPPIDNEAGNGLTNDKYTLAMARTNVVNSATSQFFINTKDNDFLNHRDNSAQGFGYAVFGKVVEGMDVVDAIESVPTGTKNGFNDVPRSAVTIKKVYRKGAKAKEEKKAAE